MPDPLKDEETQSRTLWLCLFDVEGVTANNRCANCPGRNRAGYQRLRCPRDADVIRPVDPDNKIVPELKSSAGPSKQQNIVRDEPAEVRLSKELSRLKLEDSEGTAETARALFPSESDSIISGSTAELRVTSRNSVGVKRKELEEVEDREAKHKKNEERLSMEEYLKRKPQNLFPEFGRDFLPGCHRFSEDVIISLMNSSLARPMDTQDQPSGEATSSCKAYVPGCCFDTVFVGNKVLACDDGIDTEGCEADCEMETEEL